MPDPLRTAIRGFVLRTFPRDPQSSTDYDGPAGDPGWFGPDSVTWRIHADFPGMLTGGLCALYLQTLHPQALAGVWDHSDFRRDLVGRLRRTTAFVAGTTYASTASADALAARVRRIHARVQGVDETGRPYSAQDPDLLVWVHVTEVSSFLAGFRRFCPAAVPSAVADAYYAETARIAESLGATALPRSEAAVRRYLRGVQPTLRFSERSREVLGVLERVKLPVPFAGPARDLFLGAATALLPDWAATLMRRPPARRLQAAAAASTLRALAPAFRAALDDGIAVRAMRRCGRDPAELDAWPGSAGTRALNSAPS